MAVLDATACTALLTSGKKRQEHAVYIQHAMATPGRWPRSPTSASLPSTSPGKWTEQRHQDEQ